ncbi:recombinase family protein [Actinomyces sp. 187325]|uniref:recombinase family protein n=1 Tax=Actinomyces sp. 187325 TaxID=2927828 RepID=UPI0037BF2433
MIGYTRMSTADQGPESQVDVLRAAGCERVFSDHTSGCGRRALGTTRCWTT